MLVWLSHQIAEFIIPYHQDHDVIDHAFIHCGTEEEWHVYPGTEPGG